MQNKPVKPLKMSEKTKTAPKPIKSATGHRDAAVTIVMGKNGTGKSTLAKKIIDAQGSQRVMVVTMNGLPDIWRPYPTMDASDTKAYKRWKNGIRQVYYMHHERETFEHIHKYFNNGILVLDDCRAYINARLDADQGLKRILIDFRHKMLDVYFVVHSPGQVPRQVWSFYSYAWVGATDALLEKSMPTDSVEKILEAQRLVNEKFRQAKDRGDGSHYGIFKLIKP
jgi:Zonular occludens toxin (Zot)